MKKHRLIVLALAVVLAAIIPFSSVGAQTNTALITQLQAQIAKLQAVLLTLTSGSATRPVEVSPSFSLVSSLNNQIVAKISQVSTTELKSLLDQRRALMLGLAKVNPRQFLSLVMRESDRNKLPPELKTKVENLIQIEGKIEVWHYDVSLRDPRGIISGSGSNETRNEYKLQQGQNKFLLYPTKNLSFRSGTNLRVNAYQLDNSLIVNNDIGNAVQVTATAPTLGAVGKQRVAVLMVNFLDNQSQSMLSFDQIAQDIYGVNSYSVRGYYDENSYGKSNFIGSVSDVYGYYTLPITVSEIGNVDLQSLVISQADNDANFSDYNRILIYIPVDPTLLGLGYRGYSSIGKIQIETNDGLINASVSVVFSSKEYFDTYVTSHELGHGLGAYHSGVYECGNKTIDFPNSCQAIFNSGQFHDLGSMHLNPSTKEELGWLDSENIVTIQLSAISGSRYRIYPIELSSNNLKVIKIPISSQFYPLTTQEYYYLEFKRGIGLDDVTTSIRPFSDPVPRTYHFSDYYDGLMFSMPYFDTLELDLLPHLSTGTPEAWSWDDIEDRLDIVLKPGMNFTDPYNGMMIKILDINEVGGHIGVEIKQVEPITPTSTITITSPAGGESWPQLSNQRIAWSFTGLPVATSLHIDLRHEATGRLYAFPNTQSVSDGLANLLIPGNTQLPTGPARLVLWVDVNGRRVQTTSIPINLVPVETLSNPLTVVSPNGGENWLYDSGQVVTWASNNLPLSSLVGVFAISASTGNIWGLPSANGTYQNDGYQPISSSDINSIPLDDYWIAVRTVYGGIEYSDRSDGTIKIGSPAEIVFVSPSLGQSWQLGELRPIIWTTTNVPVNHPMTLYLKAVSGNIIWLIPNLPNTLPFGFLENGVPAAAPYGYYYFEFVTSIRGVPVIKRSPLFFAGNIKNALPPTPLPILPPTPTPTSVGSAEVCLWPCQQDATTTIFIDETIRDDSKSGTSPPGGTGSVPTLTSSAPPNNAVMAQDGSGLGWKLAALTFSSDLGPDWNNPANYGLSSSQPASTRTPAPTISTVSGYATRPIVVWSRNLVPGERITLTHKPSNSSICLGYLPGDVDGDGWALARDISLLNAWVGTATGLAQPLYQTDINRDGVFNSADVTRAGELLAAPDAIRSLPACPAPITLISSQSQLANTLSALQTAISQLKQLILR